MCPKWLQGACKEGDKCRLQHEVSGAGRLGERAAGAGILGIWNRLGRDAGGAEMRGPT